MRKGEKKSDGGGDGTFGESSSANPWLERW